MESFLLWQNLTFLFLLSIPTSYSASKAENAFELNRHESSGKERAKVPNHHSSIQSSGSEGLQEEIIDGSNDYFTSSGDESSSELIGYSGDGERKEDGSLIIKENEVVEKNEGSTNMVVKPTLSSERGRIKTETVGEKLKELVEEEEEATESPNTGAESFNFTIKLNTLTPTTPLTNTLKLRTSTAQTLTGKKSKKGKVNPTEDLNTEATTLVLINIEKRPTTVIQKPTTSFLSALREIKEQLNEVLKWKKEHERTLDKVARFIETTFFKQNRLSKHHSQADKQHKRTRRSKNKIDNGLRKDILKKIEENFPCRHPKTLTLIKSGNSFFSKQDCLQCQCHMGKLSCKKDLEKCYPKACHLLDREIVPNLAIHNDGCNNCLCRFGELVCTHLRCPEAGHHYTSYKVKGLENSELENLSIDRVNEIPSRNLDVCLECDRMPGPNVCGRKQWKTFPSLCHAMFCGHNQDNDIYDHSCETLNPCASSPCDKDEQCIPYYQTPCPTSGKTTSLCQQYKCITKNLDCSKQATQDAPVCGVDEKTYSNECGMLSNGVQLAYKGSCKKNCNSEACGIESRTHASRCQAKEIKVHIDYNGACEYHFTTPLIQENDMGENSFNDQRCELVYEHDRCIPAKCQMAVLPPGACCPVCGSAVVVSLNLDRTEKENTPRPPLRLDQMHVFLTKLQSEVSPQLCKISIDLTYAMDILLVIQPHQSNELEVCNDMASEIVDKINFERDDEETGILAILGSATMVKEKPFEKMDDIVDDD